MIDITVKFFRKKRQKYPNFDWHFRAANTTTNGIVYTREYNNLGYYVAGSDKESTINFGNFEQMVEQAKIYWHCKII